MNNNNRVNDRVITANEISLANVDYATAVQVLRECGNVVNLLIKRRVFLPPPSEVKVTLTKNKKKDDFGIVLGCRIYVKEIKDKTLSEPKGDATCLQEGDVILKVWIIPMNYALVYLPLFMSSHTEPEVSCLFFWCHTSSHTPFDRLILRLWNKNWGRNWIKKLVKDDVLHSCFWVWFKWRTGDKNHEKKVAAPLLLITLITE